MSGQLHKRVKNANYDDWEAKKACLGIHLEAPGIREGDVLHLANNIILGGLFKSDPK